MIRVEPAAPVIVPLHKRHRERARPLVAPATMTQRRTSSLEALFSARALSAVILVVLLVVLGLFFQSDAFYVHRIEVGGLFHLTAEEVFGLSGVANMHVFWIDPAEIRQNILRSSSVADVEVLVSWPPHVVQIEVQERQPALVWEQAGVRTWIDVRGRVMPQRTDLEGMLRIVVEGEDTPVGPSVVIPQGVVDGALQLKTLYPDLEALLYDPVEGLGLQEGRGWRVWFGSGTDMPAKLNVYNAIVNDLAAHGIQPEIIDVGDINAPYYKIWWQDNAGEATPPADSQ